MRAERAVLDGVRTVPARAAAAAHEGAQHGAGHAPARRLQRVRAVVRLALAVVLAEAALLREAMSLAATQATLKPTVYALLGNKAYGGSRVNSFSSDQKRHSVDPRVNIYPYFRIKIFNLETSSRPIEATAFIIKILR